jgi:hypothetical protein
MQSFVVPSFDRAENKEKRIRRIALFGKTLRLGEREEEQRKA